MTSRIRITANGFAALKQQTEQVAQLNRTAATQKDEAKAQGAAIEQAGTPAGESSPVIPSGPDQQAGRTASGTSGGINNPAAPQKDKDQQNLDTKGRRRNDVPTITKTRELVANGDATAGFAHVWILGQEYVPSPTGIIETNTPGTETILGQDIVWKASKTGTYGLTDTKHDVLLGSGKGTSWVTFTDKGHSNLPPLPEDTFNPVDCFADLEGTPNEFDNYYRYHEGQRLSMHPLTGRRVDVKFAIPCGKKAFVFVYGFTDIWDMVQTNAHYYARGVYAPNGSFLGYEQRDPSTGDVLPELSATIPDWVRGFPVPNCNAPPPPYPYNNGVWSFQSFRGKSRKINAYICSNDSIREIPIPPTLQEIIDLAYPDAVDSTTFLTYRENYFPYPCYAIPDGTPIEGDHGLAAANDRGSVFTPQVFEKLNSILEFVSPSNIKQFSPNLSWAMYDTSDGSYAAYQNSNPNPFETPAYWSQLYRDGLPFYHAYWIEKNQEPNYEIYDPNYADDWEGVSRPNRIRQATLKLDPGRETRDGATDRTAVGSYWSEDFVTVWDWNDPVYCRSMCLRLGFSASNLAP